VELRLLLDDGSEESRIDVVVPRVPADDARVVERVFDPRIPRRLRALEVDERCGGDDGDEADER